MSSYYDSMSKSSFCWSIFHFLSHTTTTFFSSMSFVSKEVITEEILIWNFYQVSLTNNLNDPSSNHVWLNLKGYLFLWGSKSISKKMGMWSEILSCTVWDLSLPTYSPIGQPSRIYLVVLLSHQRLAYHFSR